MSFLQEVREAVKAVTSVGNDRIILVHCTSEYPAPFKETNLRAMATLERAFGFPVGLSDHTPGIFVPIAAAALGASVIEKHFTLDRNLPGPDHRASLEPNELNDMVKGIRAVEKALGSPEKIPARVEKAIREKIRKSIVVVEDVPAGAVLKREMLAVKRPGTGISPRYLYQLVGKKVVRSLGKNHLISWKDVT